MGDAPPVDQSPFRWFTARVDGAAAVVRESSNLLGVDERERRLAQNEALFREVNERVEAVAHQLGPDVPYEFVCECANADCTFRLQLSLRTYETVRSDPKQFVVLPLHYTPEVEELVAEEDAYWVVRKSGEAGDYVEALDPRSR